MKKKAPKQGRWRKILATGRFSLFQDVHMETTFETSWKKAGGSYGRRRFNAESVERAVERAPIVAGLEPDAPDVEGVTLLDGFKSALGETRRSPKAARDWLYQQTRFIDWIAARYPDVTHWSQVTRGIIREYLDSLAQLAPNSRRMLFQPIVQTAGWLEREYQLPNVTRRLGIGNACVRQTPTVFLADVAALLDYLQDHHPRMEACAALQGLSGLRVLEALRLTWGKVDLKRGLVEVSGTTKTSWSTRTIPVTARVLEALQRAWAARPDPQVIDLEAPVVISCTGCSYIQGDSYSNFSLEMRQAMQGWNAGAGWQVKDLRKALPTALAMAGLASDASEQYLGHAPHSVTARHYVPRLAAATPGEQEAFEEAMRVFRALVVEPVERLLKEAEVKIFNNFDQGEGEEAASGA